MVTLPVHHVLPPSRAARFKEYQAAKAAGQLLLTTDDAAKAAARVLAAKVKAKEEVGVAGADGDDEEGDDGVGVKRGRAARPRGGSKRGGRSGEGDDDDDDDDVADDADLAPDADLLAELERELEGHSDSEEGDGALADAGGAGDDVAGGGAGSLFASQDVQIARHEHYIAQEAYEERVSGESVRIEVGGSRYPRVLSLVGDRCRTQADGPRGPRARGAPWRRERRLRCRSPPAQAPAGGCAGAKAHKGSSGRSRGCRTL